MIEPAILASIHDRLDRALTLPASRYRPFIVDGARVGYVDGARAARLAEFGPDLFRVDDDAVMLAKRSGGEPSRSAAIATVARTLRAEGALPGWRNELFAVAASFGDRVGGIAAVRPDA